MRLDSQKTVFNNFLYENILTLRINILARCYIYILSAI